VSVGGSLDDREVAFEFSDIPDEIVAQSEHLWALHQKIGASHAG
jgi:hypothetical protein